MMKKQLLLLTMFSLWSIFSIAQITTVGVIGTATADDWNSDVDMVQDAADTALWSLDIDLTAGEIKFRANDTWDINWGATDFPAGTAVLGSGDNIAVPTAGNYTISFNSNSGDYSFTENESNSFSVGVIGTATPGGWDDDTDMVQSGTDTAMWSLDLDLLVGEIKFRANDTWDINWGATDFPAGTAVLGSGDNIAVPTAGNYTILFNSNTGDYSFTENESNSFSVGVIGTATPGGWDDDTDMVQSGTDTAMWSLDLDLLVGEIKFRANDTWDINWGATDFPAGTAVLGSGDNIAVPTAGNYTISFNSNSGDYSFTENETNSFSVGVIGTATPGGWDDDTDMVQSATDTAMWSLDIELLAGEIKFRANDTWDINWGATDFPAGTAVLGSGDNITVPEADNYTILFNSNTGDYSFTVIPDEVIYNSIGVIGTSTPGGWDDDTDMVRDDNDSTKWSLEMTLVAGKIKFRADDSWDNNWGATDFPAGTAVLGSPSDITVPGGGDYTIHFNSTTGEYSFEIDSPIGIIGSATPGAWDYDTDMYKDTTEHGWFIVMDLTAEECKFRAHDGWDTNWGANDFPTGTAVLGDPGNIPVDKAGTYLIKFDSLSGDYSFEEKVTYGSIGIIGDATTGGWEEDTDMTQDLNNPAIWSVDIELVDGGAKFRVDDDWAINWGGTDFPSGLGVLGSSDNIPVTAGNYRVTFNTETLEYDFIVFATYNTMGIIGTATAGGWETESPLTQDANDVHLWTGSYELTTGEAKFRADTSWTVNWGSSDFPVGTAVIEGAPIPVEAGEYNITFNSLTGAYSFEVFVVYDQISLVGKDGPFGQWPDDTPDFDTYLTVDASDNQLWTASEVTLTTADTLLDDSGVKFRANSDWTNNWGAKDFPIGIGTQDGDNIRTMEGTYNVSFNSASGDYIFSDPDATQQVLRPSDVKLFPNPTSQLLNVDISKLSMTGNLIVRVYDMQGKVVNNYRMSATNILELNVSNLMMGNYLVQISNDKYTIGRRFTISK